MISNIQVIIFSFRKVKNPINIPERARTAFHDDQRANTRWETQIKLEEHACDLKVGANDANDDGMEGHFRGGTGGGSTDGGSGGGSTDGGSGGGSTDGLIIFWYHVVCSIEVVPDKKGKQKHGEHDGTKE